MIPRLHSVSVAPEDVAAKVADLKANGYTVLDPFYGKNSASITYMKANEAAKLKLMHSQND